MAQVTTRAITKSKKATYAPSSTIATSTTSVELVSSRYFLNPFTFESLSQGQEHFLSSLFVAVMKREILRNNDIVLGIRYRGYFRRIDKKRKKQGMRDSNSQHAVLETAALPIELIPFYLPLFVFGRPGDAL